MELERAVALVAGELAGISHRARSRVTLGDVAALSGDVADGIVQPVEIKVRLLLCAQRNILEGKDGD